MIPLRVPPDLFKWLDKEATSQCKSRNTLILENLSHFREQMESVKEPMKPESEGMMLMFCLRFLEMLRQLSRESPEDFEAYMSGDSDAEFRNMIVERLGANPSKTKAGNEQ